MQVLTVSFSGSRSFLMRKKFFPYWRSPFTNRFWNETYNFQQDGLWVKNKRVCSCSCKVVPFWHHYTVSLENNYKGFIKKCCWQLRGKFACSRANSNAWDLNLDTLHQQYWMACTQCAHLRVITQLPAATYISYIIPLKSSWISFLTHASCLLNATITHCLWAIFHDKVRYWRIIDLTSGKGPPCIHLVS